MHQVLLAHSRLLYVKLIRRPSGWDGSKVLTTHRGKPKSQPVNASSSQNWRRRRWHPLQYSCLENSIDGGAWWAAVHGVAKSQTGLTNFTFTFHFHALEKEMATHSSVLAWRIPGTVEPGGLLSMGSHRVGQDWCDLAAAAQKRNLRTTNQEAPTRLSAPASQQQLYFVSPISLRKSDSELLLVEILTTSSLALS